MFMGLVLISIWEQYLKLLVEKVESKHQIESSEGGHET
jgi:hypothetical protein